MGLRFVHTRPNQLLLSKINLGSDRGRRQRLISKEVVERSSESFDGPDVISASLGSSICIACSDGLASKALSITSSWTILGEEVSGAGQALCTSRSPSSGIRPIDASIPELKTERFTPSLR